MITHLTVKNFKSIEEMDFELGKRVVLVGPNNSGKSTALQALALWDIGLKKWIEKRGTGDNFGKRSGVTINRKDLKGLSVPETDMLWHNLKVKKTSSISILIEIIVKGVFNNKEWECGLEFQYANEQSFYCRPLRINDNKEERMGVPKEAENYTTAFLPPMSGLSFTEAKIEEGRINVLLAEGKTAEVLRNLCYQTYVRDKKKWKLVCDYVHKLFGATLLEPEHIAGRGEIELFYKEKGIKFDISAAGRGMLQTLLLVTYLLSQNDSILLLDEPDAHLEILRQRQIYQILSEAAELGNNQIISASHSEVILNEAAGKDILIAFLGKPHRINDRGSQLLKALKEIPFDEYYQASQAGWVLYLEGSTDLDILKQIATRLNHPSQEALERPYVYYVANQPQKARDHFYGLKEASEDLKGFALFDNLGEKSLQGNVHLIENMWERREIENYFVTKETLVNWSEHYLTEHGIKNLFSESSKTHMLVAIENLENALETTGKGSPWASNFKISDDFLEPLFKNFATAVKMPNLMAKTNYHELVKFSDLTNIDQEVIGVLDKIYDIYQKRSIMS